MVLLLVDRENRSPLKDSLLPIPEVFSPTPHFSTQDCLSIFESADYIPLLEAPFLRPLMPLTSRFSVSWPLEELLFGFISLNSWVSCSICPQPSSLSTLRIYLSLSALYWLVSARTACRCTQQAADNSLTKCDLLFVLEQSLEVGSSGLVWWTTLHSVVLSVWLGARAHKMVAACRHGVYTCRIFPPTLWNLLHLLIQQIFTTYYVSTLF